MNTFVTIWFSVVTSKAQHHKTGEKHSLDWLMSQWNPLYLNFISTCIVWQAWLPLLVRMAETACRILPVSPQATTRLKRQAQDRAVMACPVGSFGPVLRTVVSNNNWKRDSETAHNGGGDRWDNCDRNTRWKATSRNWTSASDVQPKFSVAASHSCDTDFIHAGVSSLNK